MRRIRPFERDFRHLHGTEAAEFRVDVVVERFVPSRLSAVLILAGWIGVTAVVAMIALAQLGAILLFLSVAIGL